MSSGIKDGANINLDFGTKQITGFPAKAWCATKKYSVNNTLPIVAINTWLQFSSAYVAAVIITSNDVSFITNILSSQIMPAYILASVMLGIALVTFLVIKHIYTQEIKDEKLRDGNSTIDEKIRSGKISGRSEIVQNALTVEIIPDMSLIGNKKENFSIILPISEKQEETLENKRQENRNKIILLTVPYVLSGLIIGCALAKFGFAYITGWKEWASIAVLGITVIVGICTTLSKFKSNEVNNAYNFVQNFSNLDILLPWRKGSVMSVMEKNIKDDEEDSPIVRALKEIAGELGDRLCNSVDRFLYNVEELLKKDLVGHVNDNMETLSGRLEDKIEVLFNNLEKSIDEIKTKANNKIAECLQNSSNSISQSLKKTCDDFKKRLDQIRPTKFLSWLVTWYSTEKEDNNAEKSSSSNNNDSSSSTDTSIPSEVSCLTQEDRKKINDAILNAVRKELEPIQAELTELRNLMQGSRINNSCNGNQRNDDADPLENAVIEQRKEVRNLELRIEASRLAGRQVELKEKLSELKETKQWKEKINGKPSEFLYYLLESIRLAGKDSEEIEATLRNFDNRVIIHWKDGSQTICHIKKQGDLQVQPSTKFVDLNMRKALEQCI